VAIGITFEVLGFGGVLVHVILTWTVIFVMSVVVLAIFMTATPLVTAVILVVAHLSHEDQRLVFFVMSLASVVRMSNVSVPSFAVDDLSAAEVFIAARFTWCTELLGHQVEAVTAAVLGQAVPLFTSERSAADSNIVTVGITLELRLVIISVPHRAVFGMPLEIVFAVFVAAANSMTASLRTIALFSFKYEDSVAVRVALF